MLAARQADTGQKPQQANDDDELLETMATTLGVTKDRIVKMIDGVAGQKASAAERKADAANWKALWAEARAEDKEIAKHTTEINQYIQANPATLQTANPYLAAWNEINLPNREAASKAEIERLVSEAYERGRRKLPAGARPGPLRMEAETPGALVKPVRKPTRTNLSLRFSDAS